MMDNSVDFDPLDFSDYHQLSGKKSVEAENNHNATDLVEDLINTNKVVIFSKTSCPHCDNSKSLLNEMGVEYKTVELDRMEEGTLLQNSLGQMTNARTVPRIFINGQCVGGNSDLQSLGETGGLKVLLEEENCLASKKSQSP